MKIKHYHVYQRVDKEGKYWKCTSPNCRHRDTKEYIEGKWSQCSKCDRIYILTKESLRRKNPTCSDCIKDKASAKIAEQEYETALNTMNVVHDLFNEET